MRARRLFIAAAAMLVASAGATASSDAGAVATKARSAPPVVVAVRGNHLVNRTGRVIRLLGVDRSGTEYACEQGWGIFDGPSNAPSVAAIAAWHVNAVRVPLNEGCWLGLYTTANDPAAQGRNPTPYEGGAYRSAIKAYVALLHARRIAVILDLHALDAPDGLSVPPMADAAHSVAFWRSVAIAYKADHGVLFDLYNEPNSISWSCWKLGCMVHTGDGDYRAAGMQALVTAVRAVGATQPLLLGGLSYAADERSWRTSLPHDAKHALVVSFHTYAGTFCDTPSCWSAELAPLAKVVPVVTGEVGEYDCATHYTTSFLGVADHLGISYLGWTWDAISPGGWTCAGPALIEDYTGTPSPEGVALHGHLASLAASAKLPPPL